MQNIRPTICKRINTCQLLNPFGALMLVISFGISATVGLAHGATTATTNTDLLYSLTLDTTSAYTTLETTDDATNYYTGFTLYSINSGTGSQYTIDTTSYGVLLKEYEYAADTNASATTKSIASLIENYLTSQSPTLASSSAYTSITLDSTTSTNSLYNTNIKYNGNDISYYVEQNTSSTSATSRYEQQLTTTVNPSISLTDKNYIGINTNITPTYQYGHYNGGAISIYSATADTTITVDKIEGDFINNNIESTNFNIYQGNGGAIGLFANKSGASITVSGITGDFIGNNASRVGGALYFFTNKGAKVNVETITGDFISNTAGLGGGAIANYEGSIGTITGNFIGNSTAQIGGGAIDNMLWSNSDDLTATTIENINGVFIGNIAGTDENVIANGGAIQNFIYTYTTTTAGKSTIGSITGSFIGNSATGDGGAIYNYAHSRYDNPDVVNEAIITSITADFIGNSAGLSGGAIYNDDSYASDANIKSITGDFIYNTAGIYGGAIYNTSTIGTVTGNFISNEASGGSVSVGGAIYNYANGLQASIGNITADFIGNNSMGTLGLGGAIANYAGVVNATATIGNIVGDFFNNTATRYGGAIYNDSNSLTSATIGTITGNFLYNSVQETSDAGTSNATAKAQGGAIYNNDTIGTIYGSFIGNYATSTSTNVDVNGGAIYTTADMNFEASNQTNYFSDNYTNGPDGYDYNAIYVDIDNIITGAAQEDITLNFTMLGSGNFVMNDSISGNTDYTPLTNNSYSTEEGTGNYISVSNTNGLTITFGADSDDNYSVTGTASQTSQAVTTTFVVDKDNTTTTTTVVATTPTSSGSTTYVSTVTITGPDGNTTSTTSTDDKTVAGATATSTSTSTTYSITDTTTNNSATYTETNTTDENGTSTTTITSAKIITNDDDGTITTTTYTDSNNVEYVLVSDAGQTTAMNGDTAYGVVIEGSNKDTNTFYLNDEVTNFGEFSVKNATLYLSAYTHNTNGTSTKGGLTALDSSSSVTFGENSRLTIDMSAYSESMSSNGSIPTTAVLTGNGARLTVDETSTLKLMNVHANTTFTILSGFETGTDANNTSPTIQQDADGNYVAWSLDNVTIDSTLFTPVIIRDGYDDTITDSQGNSVVAYVISFKVNTENPLIHDSSVSDIVYNAVNDSNFGSNSSIAGERYLYNISTIPNSNEELAVLEGTVSLAKIAGVSTNTYSVNRLASDSLSSRLSLMSDNDEVLVSYDSDISSGSGEESGIGRLSDKNKSVALWFVPMYNNNKVSGASVAGFDADFVTNIYGGVIGIDKSFESDGNSIFDADLYRIGVAVHAGTGKTSTSGTFSNINNDFYYGGAFIYGVAKYGNFTLSADAGITKVVSEIQQDLSRYGFAGTEADVDSYAWNVDMRGEYCIETDLLNIIPYVGLEFVSMHTEDYTIKRSDNAGGTIFSVTSDRQNIISIPLGVQFSTHITSANGWDIMPQLSLGAIFAMGDLEEKSTIKMPGVAGSGYTSMEVVDNITFDLTAGLNISNEQWTFGLDYTLQKSENRTSHGLVGLIQYRF